MSESYIGPAPKSGFISTAVQRVTGSTNNYVDLDHSISSLSECIVWWNNVKQDTNDLTLTTSTRITLGGTLVSGDVVQILFVAKAVSTQAPATGQVTNDMLAGSITGAKLTDSTITSGKIASGVVPSLRPNAQNILINGDMAVAQRGASATGKTASGYYTCDRWNLSISSAGTWTQTQESLTSGDAHADGFSKSLKMDNTTADGSLGSGDYNQITYKFEGQDLQLLKKGTANAKKVTVGFWIKATKTGTNILEFYDNTNTRQVSQSYTVSSSNTWEYKVVNFPADTTGSLTNNNSQQAVLVFWLGAGSNFSSGTLNTSWASATNSNRAVGQVNHADSTSNNFEITGVQMEVGEFTSSTIPDFQHESYQKNYDRCLRYYYRITPSSGFRYVGWGQVDNDDNVILGITWFKTHMRASPSALEQSGTASHYKVREATTTTCDAVPTFTNADTWYGATSFKKSGITSSNGYAQGEPLKVGIDGGYLGWSAEL